MKKTNKEHGSLYTFILSLIFAIAIWVVVGIANNPDIRNTVTSLPIHYTGTAELEEKGLVIIAPTEKNTAAVTLVGKRNDLIKYRDELYILVDVSGISSPGEYSMKGLAQLANNRISIAKERIGEINIIAEKRSEKEIDVEVKQIGSLKSKLIKAVPQLDKITVSGAQSEISELDKAVISLDISKLTDPTTIYSDFRLCDKDGNVLTKSLTLSPDTETIAVDIGVYEKVTLPIQLRLNEALSGKYLIDEEKTVFDKISVEAGILDGYKVECVYADIDNADSEAAEFNLIESEGVYIPEESRRVKVKLRLIPIMSKHMDVTVHAENLGEGLEADFGDTLNGVLISAPQELLNSEDFRFIIDLEGLKEGNHKVKVSASDEKVKISEEIFINVNIH